MTKQRWHAATGVASAALLAIVLFAWAVTAVFSSGSGSSKPAVSHVVKRGPDLSWGSRCGLPHGSEDPVVGPPNATWQVIGHVDAPSAPGVGPAVADGLDRRCYQHSPAGALFAAANLLALGSLPDNAIPRDQALDHFAPGHLRDVYGSQPPVPNHAQTIAVVGFQMDILGRDSVNINLALRVNGVLGYALLPMRWTMPNGDWRAELLSAQEPFDAGRLDSQGDYIPWAA